MERRKKWERERVGERRKSETEDKRKLTIGIYVHFSAVLQQQSQNLQRARLGAIVQRRIPLDTAPIHIRIQRDQVLSNSVVALVAGNHETCVSVSVSHLYIGALHHQKLDNFVVTVKACCPQRCRIGFCRTVYARTMPHQQLHNAYVTGGGRTP